MDGLSARSADIDHHAALDARMVRAVRGIKLLNLVSWPIEIQHAFLAQWAGGHVSLPVFEYPTHDFSDARRELAAIAGQADTAHPLAAIFQY